MVAGLKEAHTSVPPNNGVTSSPAASKPNVCGILAKCFGGGGGGGAPVKLAANTNAADGYTAAQATAATRIQADIRGKAARKKGPRLHLPAVQARKAFNRAALMRSIEVLQHALELAFTRRRARQVFAHMAKDPMSYPEDSYNKELFLRYYSARASLPPKAEWRRDFRWSFHMQVQRTRVGSYLVQGLKDGSMRAEFTIQARWSHPLGMKAHAEPKPSSWAAPSILVSFEEVELDVQMAAVVEVASGEVHIFATKMPRTFVKAASTVGAVTLPRCLAEPLLGWHLAETVFGWSVDDPLILNDHHAATASAGLAPLGEAADPLAWLSEEGLGQVARMPFDESDGDESDEGDEGEEGEDRAPKSAAAHSGLGIRQRLHKVIGGLYHLHGKHGKHAANTANADADDRVKA